MPPLIASGIQPTLPQTGHPGLQVAIPPVVGFV
jgi:hypothetical protein